ncbi:integrase [Yersinia pestis]|nr:integrase [Yersinia pestis]
MKSPDRNLKVVQTLLGHSSIAVTLEYVEGDIDSLRLALEETFERKRFLKNRHNRKKNYRFP